MTREDIGGLAFSAVLGAILSVAITKPDLDMGAYVLRFLIFAVVSGIIVNTVDSWRLAYLLAASAISTAAVLATVLWIALLHHGVIASLSGIYINFKTDRSFALEVLAGLAIACFVGVFIGGLARPVTVDLLQKLLAIDVKKAKKIESLLKILVSICGTLALLIFSIA